MVRDSAAAILIICLAGCSSPKQMAGIGPGDAVDPARNADFSARFPPNAGGQGSRPNVSGRPWLFPGTDVTPNSPPRSGFQAVKAGMPISGINVQGAGVEINFENADIQTVAKTVLSDTLGLNVVIDPRVQGNVTLVSAAPIPRKDLMSAFENVMRMSNAAVIRDGDLVKIVPLPEAAGAGSLNIGASQAGYGVTIIPLRFTSAATVAKTAENFLSRPGAIRADSSRNLLMVQGTEAERQNVLNVVSSFDVEWMRNQSVGIFPLKSTAPDTMIQELQHVFETADGGQGHDLIKFQPIARMNAVMVVAHNRKFLNQTALWISRLDRPDPSGTTVRIYRLEYGSAPKIAKILNAIFVGRGGSAASDTAAKQLAPGTNSALSRLNTTSGFSNGSNGSGSAAGGAANTQSSAGNSAGGTSSSSSSNASSFDGFADKNISNASVQTTGSLPRGVFQNVRITADTSDNSIVIFSNQDDYRVIERSLRALDRPQLQVAIHATIAEVTLTNALQYGVQYYLGSTDVGAGANNGSISLSASPASALLTQALPGLNVLLGSQASPKVILSALSSLTSVKVLSAPSLVVADSQPAFLQVGDSVPISTGSATVLSAQNTIVNTITMQDTGVILKVWPHIHANGTVELEIEQEVSAVVGGNSGSGNLNPTISQRRIHTTVAVPSGETVLLGGLMSEEDDKTQTGIPILRQIQGLGDLFGNTNGSKTRTEIIIFVKPRIIRDSIDAQNVAEEFRAGLSMMHSSPSIINGLGVPGQHGALVVK
ncbi:MAG: type II secretion system secretin GspD [Methylovirgula sp.]